MVVDRAKCWSVKTRQICSNSKKSSRFMSKVRKKNEILESEFILWDESDIVKLISSDTINKRSNLLGR